MTERFMVDDAGTLIDMQTRNTYDYVSDVVTLLNELHERNEQLLNEIEDFQELLAQNDTVCHKRIMTIIEEAIQSERTELGKSVLKQLKDRIQ